MHATAQKVIFHVDMDAFFASVEIRDDPSLRGKPVLVGGAGRRGVVAAASYEARKYGCHSAQPMALALRSCPHAVVMPSRFEVYTAVSAQVFAIFDRFSPTVEGLSVDEAFLDMTGSQRLLGPPKAAAEALRQAVQEETEGLTCSVGISAVKFLAKIASAFVKPDAITEIPPGTEQEFLAPLPIRKLWGVGPKSAERLHSYGIRTVGDLRRVGEPTLRQWFGESGVQFSRLSQAMDPREVTPGHKRKSVSHEDTFGDDVLGETDLRRKLLSQATRVADRLVAKKLRGRKVQLKIRDTTFHTQTRQCTLDTPTDQAKAIYAAACRLLSALDIDRRRFRLTGVGVSDLEHRSEAKPRQLDLLLPDPENNADAQLQSVLSAVRSRFGHQALYPAEAGARGRSDATGVRSKQLDDDDA